MSIAFCIVFQKSLARSRRMPLFRVSPASACEEAALWGVLRAGTRKAGYGSYGRINRNGAENLPFPAP